MQSAECGAASSTFYQQTGLGDRAGLLIAGEMEFTLRAPTEWNSTGLAARVGRCIQYIYENKATAAALQMRGARKEDRSRVDLLHL